MTKILCAIDDQIHSGWAVDVAIRVAGVMSATLTFFMVNTPVLPGPGSAIYRWRQEDIDCLFAEAIRRAKAAGLYDTRCISVTGADIPALVLHEATLQRVDYIVVGTDYEHGLLGALRTSISRAIAANSPCPTVVVNRSLNSQPQPSANVKRHSTHSSPEGNR